MSHEPKVTRIPPVPAEQVRSNEELRATLIRTQIILPSKKATRPVARTIHYHPNGCMSINGNVHAYATVTCDGEKFRAHRVAYAAAYGECPDELDVHHRCGNPGCVNPEHLRLVSDHNHRMSHARFQHLCEIAVAQGIPRPQFIEVVGGVDKVTSADAD